MSPAGFWGSGMLTDLDELGGAGTGFGDMEGQGLGML